MKRRTFFKNLAALAGLVVVAPKDIIRPKKKKVKHYSRDMKPLSGTGMSGNDYLEGNEEGVEW